MYTSSLFLALLPSVFAAPLISSPGANLIPDKYIVKVKAECSNEDLEAAKSLLAKTPDYNYDFGGFKGFSGEVAPSSINELLKLEAVEWVTQDAEVTINDLLIQEDAPWGLGRISNIEKGNTTYVYDSSAGEGTCSYVIDTGIQVDHPEFEGRAEWLGNFAGDGVDSDGNGHGTHVAGTIGSKSYGVAKKTKLLAVKVLDSSGSGSWSGVIAGIEFAASDSKNRTCPKGAVANMSLGGAKNDAINSAVAAGVAAGLFFGVSAGNSNADASGFSPASEPTACTVGASDINDTRASFSNYGAGVEVFGPGVNVLSTWIGNGTNTISGTSMSSPHITGLGAYLLAKEGLTTAELCARIVALSSKDKIADIPSGTPNLLAFNGAT